MDSDRLLVDIRTVIQAYNDTRRNYDLSVDDRLLAAGYTAGEMAVAFTALDEWLSRGGALPVAWTWPTGAV